MSEIDSPAALLAALDAEVARLNAILDRVEANCREGADDSNLRLLGELVRTWRKRE